MSQYAAFLFKFFFLGGARLIELWNPTQDHVEFVVNAPYPRILDLLGHASIGLNTMVDEHFGINVVEFMVKKISSS